MYSIHEVWLEYLDARIIYSNQVFIVLGIKFQPFAINEVDQTNSPKPWQYELCKFMLVFSNFTPSPELCPKYAVFSTSIFGTALWNSTLELSLKTGNGLRRLTTKSKKIVEHLPVAVIPHFQ